MSTSSPKIAVLGPRQSGKTCLAIGLSAVNSRNLVVQPVGRNEDNDFLVDLRKDLRSDKNGPGKWPDATNKGVIRQFGVTLRKGSKEASVSFIDYAGEDVQGEAFIEFSHKYLEGLNGAIVLVNPGADAFSGDEKCRDATFDDYQRILEYLRDHPTKPFVALTVTAYDRLDGDLADRKDDVESFVGKLENILRNPGKRSKVLRWTRKNVTMTGHLDDQQIPRIADGEENTSWEPFDWLLEKTVWAKRRSEMLRILRILGIAAAIVAAIAVVWCGVDASEAKKQIQADAASCESHLAKFDPARPAKMGELEDAIADFKKLDRYNGTWHSSLARAEATRLDPKIWDALKARIEKVRTRIEKDDDFNEVSSLLRLHTPLSDTDRAEKKRLEEDWEKDQPRLREELSRRNILNPIRELLVELKDSHGAETLKRLQQGSSQLATLRTDNASESLKADKEALGVDLDTRIAQEGNWLVAEFGQAAPANASLQTTRSFAERLAGWEPVSTNGAVARDELLVSVSNSVPVWRVAYEAAGLTNRVIRPMHDEKRHDVEAVGSLASLYKGFESVDTTDADSSLSTLLDDARLALDNRIAEEWKKHILPDFGKTAVTGATADAVEKLKQQLESWQPATTNGVAARSSLQDTIKSFTPVWRGDYERGQYEGNLKQACSSEDLAPLAAVSPGRYPASEFLSTETISQLWNQTGQAAFDKVKAAYVSEIVSGAVAAARQKRPALSDGDKEKIRRKVRDVGPPLDEVALLSEISKAIEEKAKIWDNEKRAECNKWVADNITSQRERARTGANGLFSAYEKASRGRISDENPFFNEIVATAFYREVEKWFEADVRAFEREFVGASSIWDDSDNRPLRWRRLEETFQTFRKTCEKTEAFGKPPVATWSYRFAQLCMDKTKGNLDAGSIAKAFPQTLTISQLHAQIDYAGSFPFNYAQTAIASAFIVASCRPDGSLDEEKVREEILIDTDSDGDAPKNASNSLTEEKSWKQIWTGPKTIEAGAFQLCVFGVDATDYNKATTAKTGSPISERIPLYGTFSFPVIYHGAFYIGRLTGSDNVGVSVRIFGRKSGVTPSSLLVQAKDESKGKR